MKYNFLIVIVVSFSHVVLSQHNFSTYMGHESVLEAIAVTSDIIKERTADFEKKAEKKPLMFLQVKKKIGELNRVSNNLSRYITDLQSDVGKERILYELIEDDVYERMLFGYDGSFTPKLHLLKVKIDSLYMLSNAINVHQLTHLNDFSDHHFKTTVDFYDQDENKVDYFNYLFYDKSNYGIMMSMNYLLLDVKTFQLLYFRTVMAY